MGYRTRTKESEEPGELKSWTGLSDYTFTFTYLFMP